MLLGVALGVLLLMIQPVRAQTPTDGCVDTGLGADRKGICNFSPAENDPSQVGRLTTREYDQRQVVRVWELVRDDTDFPDHGDFRIDRKSGVLTFKVTPDYENPRSSVSTGTLADRNVYKVKAKLGDGEKFVYTEVTVRVAGVEEAETLTLSARQPEVGVKLTATLAGGDIRGLRTPDWQWQVENDSGGFADIEDAVNRSYTPRAGDVGKKLRAYVSYQDSHDDDITKLGDGDQFIVGTGVTEFAVRAKPASNVAPMFRENDEDTAGTVDPLLTSRRIEENSPPGMKVGPPVFATDNNHLAWDHADDPGGPRDVLTYSLSDGDATTTADGATADDGLFSIDQKTGQIMTKAALNKEVGLTDRDDTADGVQLQVTAIATDPSGETGMVRVDIHVLDVDEVPEVTGPAALTMFENATDLLLDQDPTTDTANDALYMAADNDLDDDTAPPAGDIQWELRGDDADKFQFVGGDGTYTDSTAITPADLTATPPTFASAASPQLRFRSAPDLENPTDEGGTPGDNVYEITVVAWDEDWEIGSREVTIRVANSDDPGMITLSHITPQVGTPITATLNDPDGVSTTITWTWESPSGTPATGTVKSSGMTSTYTPVAADTGTLTVTATYIDNGGTEYGTGAGQTTPPTATSANSGRAAPLGSNQAPKFYADGVELTTDTNRVAENEVSTLERFVLENQTRNVTLSEEDARVYDSTASPDPTVAGVVNVYDTRDDTADDTDNPTADGATGNENLHYSLSGSDAKYFEIPQANDTAATPPETRGVIKTKGPLDFEARSSYTVTLTATDPGGMTDTVTVTIRVLDVPEIEGLEERIRVDENTKVISNPSAKDPPDVSLGGLKWSLLTTDEAQTVPVHNRVDARSIDCQADSTNEDLCDDFRFSNFNSANTTLLFAIGTGEKHDAPNFEKPADVGGANEENDNVYKIVVRVAFANLRSQQGDPVPANHPNPQADEREDRVVWIRVDDVDEDPNFTDDASPRLVAENTDDALPAVAINRRVLGTVTAMDPEYGYMAGSQYNKKLVYSLDAGDYDNLFQIVPSTGEILTRSRLNYEALTELTEMGPSGGQHRIITGPMVTATDSAMPMGNSDDIGANIRVNDVNETPIPLTMSVQTGTTEVSQYPENREDTTVGTYRVSGGNTDTMGTVEWSLEGADADDFSIDGGVVAFDGTPDYENPTDRDEDPNTAGDQGKGDNAYQVTVKATLGNQEVTRDVTVTVTNVDELGTLSGDTTASYAENAEGEDALMLGTYMVSNQPADTTVMWSIEADDEAVKALFTLAEVEDSDMSRTLNFASAPDFETSPGEPLSDDPNTKMYMVTVKAENGGETSPVEVAVTFTNTDEPGSVAITPTAQPQPGITELTATLTDDDVTDMSTVAWQWSKSMTMGGEFMAITEATMYKYTPVEADGGYYLRATATYNDGHGDKTEMATTASAVNRAPAFSDESYAAMVAENSAGGTTVAEDIMATDADDDTLRYSLSGEGSGNFAIGSDGAVSVAEGASLDYETTMSYSLTAGVSDGALSDTATLEITVTDVNDAPVFAQDMATLSIAENSDAGMSIGDPVTATDEDAGDTLTYSLGGTDAASFSIVASSGQLQTKAALDHETKDSYSVMVTATDAGGLTDTIDVTITVTDVEPENFAPVFAQDMAILSVAENTAAGMNIGDPVTATDEDAGDTLTYSLGGTDAASFSIVASSGQLQTKAALDHETKDSYSVMVTATDNSGKPNNTDSIDVTINVTNVDEDGTPLELSETSPTVGDTVTATLTDPDGVVSVQDWQWSRSTTIDGTFTHITEETATYTPTDDDVGYYLKVVAKYTDGHGPDKEKEAMTGKVSAVPNPILVKFDTNKNGRIDRSEAIAALRSYRAGEITRTEAIAVLRLYRGS